MSMPTVVDPVTMPVRVSVLLLASLLCDVGGCRCYATRPGAARTENRRVVCFGNRPGAGRFSITRHARNGRSGGDGNNLPLALIAEIRCFATNFGPARSFDHKRSLAQKTK
jgi:hypothetical protein